MYLMAKMVEKEDGGVMQGDVTWEWLVAALDYRGIVHE